jgi:hypothetical protein
VAEYYPTKPLVLFGQELFSFLFNIIYYLRQKQDAWDGCSTGYLLKNFLFRNILK